MSTIVAQRCITEKRLDRRRSPGSAPIPLDSNGLLSRDDFEQFVKDYSGRLLAVAVRLLRSECDAADAVQDAFLSAYQSRLTFDAQSTVYTWLYRIVVNACLMKLRSRSRIQFVSWDVVMTTPDGCTHAGKTSPWGSSDLEREELRGIVRASITRLPDVYRRILILRDIEGLDTLQTAAALGVSRATVKTRLHRARQALRSMIESSVTNPSRLHPKR